LPGSLQILPTVHGRLTTNRHTGAMSMQVNSGGQARPAVTTVVERRSQPAPEARTESRPRVERPAPVAVRSAEPRPAPEPPAPARNIPRGSYLDIRV